MKTTVLIEFNARKKTDHEVEALVCFDELEIWLYNLVGQPIMVPVANHKSVWDC